MNDELMDVKQVADYFGVSVSTIRRRLRDRKNGIGTFIMPVFGFGKIAKFRKSDLESWSEVEPDIITVETPAQQNHKIELAQKGLASLGIKVPQKSSQRREGRSNGQNE